MSNPALDRQVRIALRDDQKAERFAEHIAQLAAQLVNTSFKFAEEIQSSYESTLVPKRRCTDKRFDQNDHAKLALGAFSFFMHVLDRYLLGMDINLIREAVLDLIFRNVVQRVYARSFTGPPAESEKFVLNHFDARASLLAEAQTILSDASEDENTAIWRASRAICEQDLGRDDRRLRGIVESHLRQGLEGLSLADNLTAIIDALCTLHPSSAVGRAHGQIGLHF